MVLSHLQPGIRTADAEAQRQFAFGGNPVAPGFKSPWKMDSSICSTICGYRCEVRTDLYTTLLPPIARTDV